MADIGRPNGQGLQAAAGSIGGVVDERLCRGHRLHRVRPYHWGAIYISDAECRDDFDIDFHSGDGPVFATATHAAVAVTNARTVPESEEDVTLDLRVEDVPVNRLPHEVVLDVPSGRLNVGDADADDEVALQPGRWLLQIAVDHPSEARRVEIAVSPL